MKVVVVLRGLSCGWWVTRLRVLFMAEVNVAGVEGVDPVNKALVQQRW